MAVIARRGFLSGVAAFLAAPAIIRTPGLLMPVRVVAVPDEVEIDFFFNDNLNINKIMYHNHTVYQQNTKGQWYEYQGNSQWAQWNQPLPWDRSG